MKTTESITMIAVGMAILMFSGVALADEDMQGVLNFDRVDVNGDACVDWEELRNSSLRFFESLDTNRDNLIAGDEHPPAVNEKGEAVRPGTVDTSRFQAAMYVAFDTADQDQDGCLSRKEYESD